MDISTIPCGHEIKKKPAFCICFVIEMMFRSLIQISYDDLKGFKL